MIRIKDVPFIPDLPYAQYAISELKGSGPSVVRKLEKKSDRIVVILNDNVPLAVVGIIRESLVDIPMMWAMLCETAGPVYYLRALRPAFEELRSQYTRLAAVVDPSWTASLHFARFFGFRPTGRTVKLGSVTYNVMEW